MFGYDTSLPIQDSQDRCPGGRRSSAQQDKAQAGRPGASGSGRGAGGRTSRRRRPETAHADAQYEAREGRRQAAEEFPRTVPGASRNPGFPTRLTTEDTEDTEKNRTTERHENCGPTTRNSCRRVTCIRASFPIQIVVFLRVLRVLRG